jgi:hypothetical protein
MVRIAIKANNLFASFPGVGDPAGEVRWEEPMWQISFEKHFPTPAE